MICQTEGESGNGRERTTMKKKALSAGPANPLWTRDFTIITFGSVISMLGNAMSGFAMSLLVLDYTQSNLLYAIYLAVFTLPQIIAPIFSGAILDRFSRKRMIYTLDFISAGVYAIAAWILSGGWFSFPVLAVYCFLIGTINSIYTVAYQSFYPLLITEGNFSKAYSVSSILETMSALMVPVATFLYNQVGITPLLAINAVSFLGAAILETQIKAPEEYIDLQKRRAEQEQTHGRRQLFGDIKEGLQYLLAERGLLAITLYFTICSLAMGASNVITLPYFKNTFENGEYIYMIVWGTLLFGRALGGLVHYKIKYPVHAKYTIAICVYVTVACLEGTYLYTTVPAMVIMCFITGVLGVTSYTIRISSTQNYVPHEKKGRYNGAFNMLNTTGSFCGQLLAGALTTLLPARYVLSGFMLVNAVSAILIIGGNRKRVKEIYNHDQ